MSVLNNIDMTSGWVIKDAEIATTVITDVKQGSKNVELKDDDEAGVNNGFNGFDLERAQETCHTEDARANEFLDESKTKYCITFIESCVDDSQPQRVESISNSYPSKKEIKH